MNDRGKRLWQEAPLVNAADVTTVVPLPGIQTGPSFNREYVRAILKGGFSVVHVNNLFWLYDDFYQAARRLGQFYALVSGELREEVRIVHQFVDIQRAREEGKLAVIVHSQNATILDNDIRLLPVLRRLGIVDLQLSHQGRTLLADGRGEKRAHGLSVFGEYVIKEMNRLGMIVDLAHASYQSVMEAVEISVKPTIISHATLNSVFSHPRNLTDEEAQAVAARGGVVGIMGIPLSLVPNGHETGADVAQICDHIDRMVAMTGIDHVGIGLETGHRRSMEDLQMNFLAAGEQFGGTYTPISGIFPEFSDYDKATICRGLEEPEHIKANFIEELIKRGYKDDHIRKILGGNFLRVYEEVLTPPPFA